MAIRLLDTSDLWKHLCGKGTSESHSVTFLLAAVRGCGGDPAIVNAMLDRGAKADIDKVDYYEDDDVDGVIAPLHYAACVGHPRVVEVLVAAGGGYA